MTLPPCPMCSRFRRRHSELLSDAIYHPRIRRKTYKPKARGKTPDSFYLVDGCADHTKPLWKAANGQPYCSEEEAVEAWRTEWRRLWALLWDEKRDDMREYLDRQKERGEEGGSFELTSELPILR